MSGNVDPLKRYYDPKTPAGLFDQVGKDFKRLAPTVFGFLEADYGFSVRLTGEFTGVIYLATKSDLEIRVILDKYIVEAHTQFIGKTELELIRVGSFTRSDLITIEECFNPKFKYAMSPWGEPGYVKNELMLCSSILKKYLPSLLEEQSIDFMKQVTICFRSAGSRKD